MGLFDFLKKTPDLSKYEVAADATVPKFEYEGKTYDLNAYVHARELELRAKFNSDHIKATKNYKKAQNTFAANKTTYNYLEYTIGRQLWEGVEKVKVKAIDVVNNCK